MNWLLEELEAEKARTVVDDAPGYTAAQNAELENLAYGYLSHRDLANKVRMLLRTDLQHEGLVVGARDRIAWLEKRAEDLEVLLKEHHDWHLAQGEVSAPDGLGGHIIWDASDAYGESDFGERTYNALPYSSTQSTEKTDER